MPDMNIRTSVVLFLFLILVLASAVMAQEGEFVSCCEIAKAQRAYLNKSISQNDYSCGQTYSSHTAPAFDMEVPFSFCSQRCLKYEESSPNNANQWAVPLVGYILPAVIFSMTIPRPFKIEVPDFCFALKLSNCDAFYKVPLSLTLASLFIIADTTFWVMCIFSMAGPMIFSGILEGVIDYVVVTRLQEHIEVGSRTLRLSRSGRVDLLVGIVAGNLQMAHNHPRDTLTEELKIPEGSQKEVPTTEAGLIAMMRTQQSFGAIVGAPVIFFIGSFIYNVIDLASKKGDNDSAHTLAFGIWWMVVLHVAIVSGCLLASNNPATAGAIARKPPTPDHRSEWQLWAPVYDSLFLPAWMHNRGSNKMSWIKEIKRSDAWARDGNQWFEDEIHLTSMNWVGITLASILLIFIPCVLAGLVSYNTPKIGLSCRSLTFLVYFCAQVVLILANLWWHIYKDSDETFKNQVRPKQIVTAAGIFIIGCAAFVSVFTTVAGTLMQLIGVYRNCICGILASEWPNPHNATIPLASDTATSRHSSKYWSGTGYGAIGFIAVVCYVGWWYQRFLRSKFVKKARIVTADQGGDSPVIGGVAPTIPRGASPIIDGAPPTFPPIPKDLAPLNGIDKPSSTELSTFDSRSNLVAAPTPAHPAGL